MGSALRRAAKNGEEAASASLADLWSPPKPSRARATGPLPMPRLTLPRSAPETRDFEQISLQERQRSGRAGRQGRGRIRQALRLQGRPPPRRYSQLRALPCPNSPKSHIQKLTRGMEAGCRGSGKVWRLRVCCLFRGTNKIFSYSRSESQR